MVWLPFFIFPYIGNNHPNWLSYFSEGFKPPTSYDLNLFSGVIFGNVTIAIVFGAPNAPTMKTTLDVLVFLVFSKTPCVENLGHHCTILKEINVLPCLFRTITATDDLYYRFCHHDYSHLPRESGSIVVGYLKKTFISFIFCYPWSNVTCTNQLKVGFCGKSQDLGWGVNDRDLTAAFSLTGIGCGRLHPKIGWNMIIDFGIIYIYIVKYKLSSLKLYI